jgi:hypothetical protein
MALTKSNHQMANLPCLASGTGIRISLIDNESRGICQRCHLFQKSMTNTGSKSLFKLSGNAGNSGLPVQGVLRIIDNQAPVSTGY